MIQPTKRDLKKSDLRHEFRKEAHNVREWPRIKLNENASEKSKQVYEEWLAMMLEDKDKEPHPFV